MNSEKQLPPDQEEQPLIPSPLEVFIVIFLGTLLGQIMAVIAVPGTPDTPPGELMIKLRAIIFYLVFAGVPLGYFHHKQYPLLTIFRLEKKVNPTSLNWCIPYGMALYFIVEAIGKLVGLIAPMDERYLENMAIFLGTESFFAWILLVIIILGMEVLVNEGLFRGVLLQSLMHQTDTTRAVVIAAVAYAAVKFDILTPGQGIYIFAFGFFLTWASWRAGSLWAAIAVSFTYHAVGLLDAKWGFDEHLPFYLWNGVMSPVYVLPAIGILYFIIRQLDAFYRSKAPSSSAR